MWSGARRWQDGKQLVDTLRRVLTAIFIIVMAARGIRFIFSSPSPIDGRQEAAIRPPLPKKDEEAVAYQLAMDERRYKFIMKQRKKRRV